MKDGKYELSDIKVVRLSKVYNLSSFDCGDEDLNDFLKNDALRCQEEKIVNTLLIIYLDQIAGFLSLCADAIKLGRDEKDRCDITKPLAEYPAIKIARLAVDRNHQKRNLGSIIVSIVIGLIRKEISKIIACRFITVDSYHSRVDFYGQFGYVINEHEKYRRKDQYVSMRFDLLNPISSN